MRRTLDWVARASDALATLAFAGFLLAILAQVAYRYLGITLVFSEELARLLNVYMVFFGLIVVTNADGHLKIDILERIYATAPRFRRALRGVHQLLALIFLLMLAYGSYLLAQVGWGHRMATMAWLSHGHLYLAPLIGSTVSAFVVAIQFLETCGFGAEGTRT